MERIFWWNYVLLLSKIRIYKNGYLKSLALYCHTDLLRANALRGVAVSNVSYEQICVFFQTMFDFFYHFFVFTFFIKIITTSSKGRETARSPKPSVSLPLNPSLFGHGLGLCPKNLHASKWVALATNKSGWHKKLFYKSVVFYLSDLKMKLTLIVSIALSILS